MVTGMCSVEGEAVPFKAPVLTAQAKGAVERWLVEVRSRGRDTCHNLHAVPDVWRDSTVISPPPLTFRYPLTRTRPRRLRCRHVVYMH